MSKLTGQDRQHALAILPDWQELSDRDAISRTFTFKDFSAAFAFMTRVAMLAEQANHHPEWFNVYNRIEVTLATHDAGGLTTKDTDLATKIDAVASSMAG